MESELKPWKYDIQYGPEGEDAYSWVYDDHGAMVATMKTHKAKQIVDAMNTRPAPAATDTGLVKTPRDTACTIVDAIHRYTWEFSPNPTAHKEQYDLVEKLINDLLAGTRSQAVELLAAKDARIEELTSPEYLTEKLEQVGVVDKEWQERAEKAEADNAAQDARIKELEKLCNDTEAEALGYASDKAELEAKLETYHEEYENRKEGYEKTIDSLEEKLAAAEKALTMIAKIELSFPEELRDIARAVLGGKPS